MAKYLSIAASGRLTEVATATVGGTGNEGLIPTLGAADGRLADTMMPLGIGADTLIYAWKDAATVTVAAGLAAADDGLVAAYLVVNPTDVTVSGLGNNQYGYLWIGQDSVSGETVLRANTNAATPPANMLHTHRLRWHIETDGSGNVIRFAPPKIHLDRAIPTYYDGPYRPVNCLIRDGRKLARTNTLFAALYAEIGHAHDIGFSPVSLTVTANASANTLNATAHAWVNTQRFRISSTGTLPSPLAAGTTYFVVTTAANTFQASLTSGGAAIDLTTAGTGIITCTKIDTFQAFAHPFVNNDTVDLHIIGGVLPGGLSEATTYYIVNATTNTLQLATTSGGAALVTTNDGTPGRWTLAHTGFFRIPNGQGRALIGAGTGSGLTARLLGASHGTETHILSIAEMPSHNHTVNAASWPIGSGGNGGVGLPDNTGYTGGGLAHNNMQPSLVGLPIMAY